MRVIVAAPLVAVVGFAGLALAASARQAGEAGELGLRARLAVEAGGVAYELQRERAAAAALLTGGGTAQQDAYVQQAAATDQAVARFERQRRLTTEVPAGARAVLDRLDRGLEGLHTLRAQVRTAAQASVSATTFGYRIVIADLLAYRESTAQGVPSTEIADAIRAAAALSKSAEAVGQQQVAVMRAVATGQLTPAMQQDITAARTSFTEASLVFAGLARPAWRVWWERAGSGEQAVALQRLEDQVSRARPGEPLTLSTRDWIAATQGQAKRLYEVQRRVDAAVLADVDAARAAQERRAVAEGAAMAVALGLTVVVTWAVARQITRRLRRLRDAANAVAFEKLPAMVARLRTADHGAVTPQALAEQSATPLEASNDEIGEVGQAFSAVHRAAVRTAAEQAVMRANTADIFIHLSRREQRLVDAVLAQVDRVERDETDPDRLNRLYTLDHLATRMARINASLLVLGGVGVGRVREERVPLPKILQAAMSQIEHYTRVRLGVVDGDVAVVPEAVDEVVHLLAELMDNATTYSAPDTEAWATARGLGDRVIVQISDEGVGLPPRRLAQLNDVLRRPPDVDVAAVRAMGLTVVGQLASRLGASVELRPGPKLGTIAEVTLPGEVIVPIGPEGEYPLPVGAEATPAHAAAIAGAPAGGGPGGSGPGGGRRPAQRTTASGLPVRAADVPVTRAPGGPPVHPYHHGGPGGGPGGGSGGGSGGPGYGADPGAIEPARTGSPVFQPAAGAHDRTQELPIFQQVNNWFRTGIPTTAGQAGNSRNPAGQEPAGQEPAGRDTPGAAGDGSTAHGSAADGSTAHGSAAHGSAAHGSAAHGSAESGGNGYSGVEQPATGQYPAAQYPAGQRGTAPADWYSPADAGWRAATEISTPKVVATTASGLPVRTPQRHLVPGAVEPATAYRDRPEVRDPAKVAAAMSAYARGVTGRRPNTTGQPTGQPAGTGQPGANGQPAGDADGHLVPAAASDATGVQSS